MEYRAAPYKELGVCTNRQRTLKTPSVKSSAEKWLICFSLCNVKNHTHSHIDYLFQDMQGSVNSGCFWGVTLSNVGVKS